MSRIAWVYILGVTFVGALLTVGALGGPPPSQDYLGAFVLLTVAATASQLAKSLFESKQGADIARISYSPILIFIFTGLVLLPSSLFVVLVIIPRLIEWGTERYRKSKSLPVWYIQPFNIANHIIDGLVAKQVYLTLVALPNVLGLPTLLVAGSAAVLVYLFLNHSILALALVLARGVSWKDTGLLTSDGLVPDAMMLWMGAGLYLLWAWNPWFILFGLAPLEMIRRALAVPQLKREAQTDEKTGLMNARHFSNSFSAELQRARRFNHPLSVIMADLDLLRNVNNTYGHLAGDMVLVRVGEVIRSITREYDMAGRFGGEEFAIALPETGIAEATAIAERIRQTIESNGVEVQTSPTPIHVTMSLGVSTFPQDATEFHDLIHQADLAVYHAKLRGRNCVALASDVPRSAKLERAAPEDRFELLTYGVVTRASMAEPAPARTTTTPVRPIVESRPAKHTGTLFVTLVIVLGIVIAVWGFSRSQPDWLTVAALGVLAALAELFQVRLYGDSTVSVSATIGFAAALIVGIPGVVFASLGIVLMHLARNIRTPWYKTAFNWATHVIAAAVPAVGLRMLGLTMSMENFMPLVLFTSVTAIAYYLIESGSVITAISLFEGKAIVATWRHEFRWMATYYLAFGLMGLFMALLNTDAGIGILGVLVFVVPMAVLYYAQKQYVGQTTDSVNELQRMNLELSSANSQVMAANTAIRQINDELFLTLSRILDVRDPFVTGHAVQVAKYAAAIAKEMNWPADRVTRVYQAALLHDIGKIGVSEKVLHKPSKLNLEEYEFVKKHAVLGADFLETLQGLRHLAPLIRYHHEWWNGQGYPRGLARDQIPLEARILAVCDAVEAMASDRPYHDAMSLQAIIRELSTCSGTQFDPSVVEAFVRVAEREGTALVINSAREVVERANNHGQANGRAIGT